MPNYHGQSRINSALKGTNLITEHYRKMEKFEAYFAEEMGPAMQQAVELARSRAEKNAPRGETGGLAASITGRTLNPTKNTIRGAIYAGAGQPELKAFSQEVGRFYGNRAAGTTHYKEGIFFLYYGAAPGKRDSKADQIAIPLIFLEAQERIVKRLVVK